MNETPKVLVVDNGERKPDCALSAELGGLGYSSVTASLEAADDVLALIPYPAAILLQMPRDEGERRRFLALAQRLKAKIGDARIPVVMVEDAVLPAGGFAALLDTRFGGRAAARPDL